MEPRFESKVERVTESGCWIWTGSITKKGYGRYHTPGSAAHWSLAHRASWEMYKGPIPDGMLVCHHCDIPQCVNPSHLFLGTHKDNLWDAINKGRLDCGTRKYWTHCPKGHEHNAENMGTKASGVRYCKPCNRERAAMARQLKRSSDY